MNKLLAKIHSKKIKEKLSFLTRTMIAGMIIMGLAAGVGAIVLYEQTKEIIDYNRLIKTDDVISKNSSHIFETAKLISILK